MSPSEISDLIQSEEIESGGGWLLQGVGFEREEVGAGFHVFEKFAVVAGSVRTKILQNGGKRCVGHGDLEEVVAEWDLFCCSIGCCGDGRGDITMLSFAPDSPRNDKGSSDTPSYITP